MKRSIALGLTLMFVVSLLLVAVAAAQGGSISRGAQLYDNWWKVIGADAPTADQALWATQSTNTRSGADTWRCKECHGWDAMGKDGAYSSGSHATGFIGVYAARTKSVDDIVAALKGGTNADHDFSTQLDDQALTDLATFITQGLVDDHDYIDYEAKAAKNGDKDHGKTLFDGLCAACHGADGTTINFKDEQHPEYVGTLAGDNAQEFFHKARFGQPGAAMPASIDMGWSPQDAADVLAYAQTLPTGEATAEPVLISAAGSAQRGGQLYDNWFKVVGASPQGDQPLWATQSTNTRSGGDTWRCKECHGWDYKGVDGAYGSGSHKTGFPGVYAARTKSVDDIVAALKGGTNADHDFSADMSDADLTDLATFITTALIDTDLIIDPATKAVKGNATDGKALFDSTCAACHNADGLAIDFHAGTDKSPEFVGTIAADNPWELFNKIRSGTPGEAMPAQLDAGSMTGSWTMDEVSDVLAYAQTLPTEKAAATAAPTELPTTGGPELPVLPLGLAIAGLALLGLGLYRRNLLQNS